MLQWILTFPRCSLDLLALFRLLRIIHREKNSWRTEDARRLFISPWKNLRREKRVSNPPSNRQPERSTMFQSSIFHHRGSYRWRNSKDSSCHHRRLVNKHANTGPRKSITSSSIHPSRSILLSSRSGHQRYIPATIPWRSRRDLEQEAALRKACLLGGAVILERATNWLERKEPSSGQRLLHHFALLSLSLSSANWTSPCPRELVRRGDDMFLPHLSLLFSFSFSSPPWKMVRDE